MPGASIDVVCIGNAIVDVLSQVDDAFVERWDLARGTMTLVEENRAEELYAAMTHRIQASGGSAANTAAGVASFGGTVEFIGRVANDGLGAFFGEDLRSLGVHYEVPMAGPHPSTARSMIFVTPDAHRTMNTFLGASGMLEPADVDAGVVAQARIVYCEGYLWDRDDAKAAIEKGMDAARDAGRAVSFTLSDPFCVDRHRDEFRDLVADHVDVLFANQAELESLFETEDLNRAIELVRDLVEVAAVTCSELGSVVVTADDAIRVPAVSVTEVIDTTGAGDLYAAGFLYAWAQGRPLAECAHLGHVGAAEVISHVGARPLARLADLM